jgi:hypothetical protein
MGNQIYFKIAGKKKKWIEGSNRQTHFWKRTIQRLFHQNFVLIEQIPAFQNTTKMATTAELNLT